MNRVVWNTFIVLDEQVVRVVKEKQLHYLQKMIKFRIVLEDDDQPMLRSIANIMKISGCDVPEWMLQLKKIELILVFVINLVVRRIVVVLRNMQ